MWFFPLDLVVKIVLLTQLLLIGQYLDWLFFCQTIVVFIYLSSGYIYDLIFHHCTGRCSFNCLPSFCFIPWGVLLIYLHILLSFFWYFGKIAVLLVCLSACYTIEISKKLALIYTWSIFLPTLSIVWNFVEDDWKLEMRL